MRFPQHLLNASTCRSEPLMAAMAAVAVGMFVGTWIIGPSITHNSPEAQAPAAQQKRITFEDMVARPDPMPYRAPTPTFDTAGQPSYAAAAKEKAQAELGGAADPEAMADEPGYPVRSSRAARTFDRHRVY
ncbi:MAG: hypothetical protein ACXWJ8_01395 [Xanthobacteraceae bacterium]